MRKIIVNDGRDWIDIYFGKNDRYMITIKKYFLGFWIYDTDKFDSTLIQKQMEGKDNRL